MNDINDILNGSPIRKNNKISKTRQQKSLSTNINNKKIDDQVEQNEIDKGGRPRKDVLFKEERKRIYQKLLNILGVSKNGDIFYVDDLDNDNLKQNQILALEDDIKKCFSCSNWKCFMEDGVQKKYVSMAKHILKHMNVRLTAVSLSDTKKRKVIRQGYVLNF